jgi:hypothetical protein
MSGEILAPRKFDSPLGDAAAGGEVTGSGRRVPWKHRIFTRPWKRLDVSLNKLQAQEPPGSAAAKQVSEACFGRSDALWAGERRPLRIEKQRNLVRTCDLLIDIEKGGLKQDMIGRLDRMEDGNHQQGLGRLKGQGTMRRAWLARID